jgi:hypothetical protein
MNPSHILLAKHVCDIWTHHYWKKDLCRVSSVLPSVFFRALGKETLCRVPFLDTRQRSSSSSAFFRHSAKSPFAECFFRTLGKDNFQIIFWSSKLIQIKIFSTTKLYNLSRCTILVLDISSFDKINVNLFTKHIYLSRSLWN